MCITISFHHLHHCFNFIISGIRFIIIIFTFFSFTYSVTIFLLSSECCLQYDDECFDLYAFLKQKKMINGIPAIFLYSKKIYKNVEDNKLYIPQASISGTKEDQIKKVLHLIQ